MPWKGGPDMRRGGSDVAFARQAGERVEQKDGVESL